MPLSPALQPGTNSLAAEKALWAKRHKFSATTLRKCRLSSWRSLFHLLDPLPSAWFLWHLKVVVTSTLKTSHSDPSLPSFVHPASPVSAHSRETIPLNLFSVVSKCHPQPGILHTAFLRFYFHPLPSELPNFTAVGEWEAMGLLNCVCLVGAQ